MDPDAELIGSTEKNLAIENTLRSIVMLGILGCSIVACGGLLGGRIGLFLGIALGIVVVAVPWFLSERLVLRGSGARRVDGLLADDLHTMLTELSLRAAIPTPRCYVAPSAQPNAFAIGRTPRHAAIIVTEGLLSLLEPVEIRAILAHELIHIRRRDTLGSAIAGAALGHVFAAVNTVKHSSPLRWHGDRENPGVVLTSGTHLVMSLLAPAHRDCRESEVDFGASDLTGDPESLARALSRISGYAQVVPMDMALAHVSNWVVNPLGDRDSKAWLFATDPPVTDRIDRLLGAEAQRMAT